MKNCLYVVMPLLLIVCGSEIESATPQPVAQPIQVEAGQVEASELNDDAFTMRIMDVFQISGKGTILTGTVKSGTLHIGDHVCLPLTSGDSAARTVEGIEMFRKMHDKVETGQNVGVLVATIEKSEVDKKADLHTMCP